MATRVLFSYTEIMVQNKIKTNKDGRHEFYVKQVIEYWKKKDSRGINISLITLVLMLVLQVILKH
jgi:hypothetical protein